MSWKEVSKRDWRYELHSKKWRRGHREKPLTWLLALALCVLPTPPESSTGSRILSFSYQSWIKEVPQGIPKGQPDEIVEVPSLQMTLVVSRWQKQNKRHPDYPPFSTSYQECSLYVEENWMVKHWLLKYMSAFHVVRAHS